uniref:Uncharacterized protein n=1 Tax=Panagrolaimus sp. JU765 TaxID=591449 RepID=A0AC34QJP8_9BILA
MNGIVLTVLLVVSLASSALADNTESCQNYQIHEIHEELTGLHLRKTEQIKDCVKEDLENAVVVGSPESNKKCRRIFEKVIQNIARSNKKSKKGGKKQRKITQKKLETRCRKDRRTLHKKCSKIGACCSLMEPCREKHASLTEQIIQLKSKLKQHRVQCRSAAN